MQIHGTIYAIYDPRDGNLRYVGQTTKTLVARLAAHVCPSSLRRHSYLARWLGGVVASGLPPRIEKLDEAYSQAELDEKEQWWIAYLRCQGYQLVNLSDGGNGPWGHKVSQEARDKIAYAQIGFPRKKHTAEWREKMSRMKKGVNTNTPEHMEKLHAAQVGRPHSQEARDNNAMSHWGKVASEETKAKISAANMGRVNSPESIKKMVESRVANGHTRDDIKDEEIMRLWDSGMGKRAIARKVGINQQLIQRRIRKFVKEHPEYVRSNETAAKVAVWGSQSGRVAKDPRAKNFEGPPEPPKPVVEKVPEEPRAPYVHPSGDLAHRSKHVGEKVLELAADGKTAAQIAAELKVAPTTVYKNAKRLSPAPVAFAKTVHSGEDHYEFRKDVTIEDILRLHGEGKTYQQIGDALGVSNVTIGKRLKKYWQAQPGYVAVDKEKELAENKAYAKKRIGEGATKAQIAAERGVNPSTVRYWLGEKSRVAAGA